MMWGNQAQAYQRYCDHVPSSLCSAMRGATAMSPRLATESGPHSPQPERAHMRQWRPGAARTKKTPDFIGFLLLSFSRSIFLQFFSKFSLMSVTAIGSNLIATGDSHTNWDKSEQERQRSYDWNMESKTWHKRASLWNRQGLNREQACDGRGWGRRMDWESGDGKWKLSHLERTNNKVLLYSMGNRVQSPGINPNGKEYL